MPQLALYRRYRPASFAEVVGQDHVTGPLQRALAADRIHHAYLFSGPRGCGKTSSARILARSLNCERGPTPTPCGVCRSCRELAPDGPGNVDVLEIDAATHGRVDDTRDLRERVFFTPVSSRYRVYVIDEAHMVSAAGFNALLKVVEEPPEHLVFVFATTEPDKVLQTIRSRTHHYPFRLVPPAVLSRHLSSVVEREGATVAPAALALVVRAGGGSVRDSMSVLDQLLGGAGPDGVTLADAVALLGFTPQALIDEVVDALAAGDGRGVFAAAAQVVDAGQDPRRFVEDLLRRFRDLVLIAAIREAPDRAELLDVPPETVDALVNQEARVGRAAALRAAELLDAGLTAIRGATAPRLHLELLLARLLLPGVDADESGLLTRLERLERRLASPVPAGVPDDARTGPPAAADAGTPSPGPAATAVPSPHPAPPGPPARSEPAAVGTVADERPGLTGDTGPAGTGARTGPRSPSTTAMPAMPATTAMPARTATPATAGGGGPPGAGTLGVADLRRLWEDVLEDVKGRSRIAHAALTGSQVVGIDAGRVTVALTSEGQRANFVGGGRVPVLREALAAVLALQVEIDAVAGVPGPGAAGGPAAATPAPPAAPAASAPSTPARAGRGPAPRPAPAPRAPDTAPAPAGPSAGPVSPSWVGWPEPAVPGGGNAASAPTPDRPASAAGATAGAAGASPGAEASGDRDEVGPDDPDLDDPEVRGIALLARELGAEVIGQRHAP